MPKKPKVKAPAIDVREAFKKSGPSKDQLKIITDKARLCAAKMIELEGLQQYCTELSKEITRIRETEIPDAMAAAGMEDFSLEDGTKVKVADFIRGSLPKDEAARRKALAWIMKQDGGKNIIKTSIELSFDRGDAELADRVRQVLQKMKLPFSDIEMIHAQTLASFAREKAKGGESVPFELLGLFAGRAAKITLPKEKD